MLPLSAVRRAGRQGPKAQDLGQIYRALRKHHTDVSLPDFVRLVALLVDAAEEDAR